MVAWLKVDPAQGLKHAEARERLEIHGPNVIREQARMQLLAISFTPTHAEYVYLQGRRVLSDQLEFLKAHFPRKSPLHSRQS